MHGQGTRRLPRKKSAVRAQQRIEWRSSQSKDPPSNDQLGQQKWVPRMGGDAQRPKNRCLSKKLFPKQTKFPGQLLHTVIGYPIPFLYMCRVTRDSWCRNSWLHRMRTSNCFILFMILVKTSLSRRLVQPPPPPAQPCRSKPTLQPHVTLTVGMSSCSNP